MFSPVAFPGGGASVFASAASAATPAFGVAAISDSEAGATAALAGVTDAEAIAVAPTEDVGEGLPTEMFAGASQKGCCSWRCCCCPCEFIEVMSSADAAFPTTESAAVAPPAAATAACGCVAAPLLSAKDAAPVPFGVGGFAAECCSGDSARAGPTCCCSKECSRRSNRFAAAECAAKFTGQNSRQPFFAALYG